MSGPDFLRKNFGKAEPAALSIAVPIGPAAPDWRGLRRRNERTTPLREIAPESFVPQSPQQRLVEAAELFEQGQAAQAFAAISALLRDRPDWIEGHVTMAQLLSQTGSPEAFDQFLTDTIRCSGDALGLVTTCLRLLSEAGRHARVDALVPDLRRQNGDHLFFTLIEAITASELGDTARASALFDDATKRGGRLSLPHVRHLLRAGDPAQAAEVAEQFLRMQPSHQGGWGLLATAWRLLDDPRHGWLVERPELVQVADLAIAPEALETLAAALRALHVASHHPLDQSLRGGTQTAGRLFRRSGAEIAHVKELLSAAVRGYLDALPPIERGHPLLGQDRARFHFSDSWSVRLLDGGYHVSHFHPQGALSSAFYVTLPALGDAADHAGWLTIGEPPECLGTGLPPLQYVEPKAGRLVLFPSFLWHGTRPFSQGERMTIAFDTLLAG